MITCTPILGSWYYARRGRHDDAHAEHHEHGTLPGVEAVEEGGHGPFQVQGKQQTARAEQSEPQKRPGQRRFHGGEPPLRTRFLKNRGGGKQQGHQENPHQVVDLRYVEEGRPLADVDLSGLLPERNRPPHARCREGGRHEQTGQQRPVAIASSSA